MGGSFVCENDDAGYICYKKAVHKGIEKPITVGSVKVFALSGTTRLRGIGNIAVKLLHFTDFLSFLPIFRQIFLHIFTDVFTVFR